MKFNVEQVYSHTGKEYYVKRRTEKSVWISVVIRDGVHMAPSRKSIRTDNEGNERIRIDEYRTLFA